MMEITLAFFLLLSRPLADSSNPNHRDVATWMTPPSNNTTILMGYSHSQFDDDNNHNKKNTFAEILGSKSPISENQVSNQDEEPPRSKRGVLHLYNMVSCATGCNPLSYKGYGCYCGFLGSGYVVDGIDRCCQNHDWCYNTANCPMFLEYFVPYYWKCYHGRPLCAIPQEQPGGAGSCAQRLCECDRVLSECLRRYPCPGKRAICRSSPWRFLQNALMNL